MGVFEFGSRHSLRVANEFHHEDVTVYGRVSAGRGSMIGPLTQTSMNRVEWVHDRPSHTNINEQGRVGP